MEITDSETENEELVNAFTSFADNYIAEDTINDSNSSFHKSVISLHYQMVFHNQKLKYSDVKVTQNATQKNHYSYDATAILSADKAKDREIKLSGIIQYDENEKVDFMTVTGDDFKEIMTPPMS